MMGRRRFLSILSGVTAAAFAAPYVPALLAHDPELELWRPGARTIFLPPERRMVEPEGVQIFDACIDLERALTDHDYFVTQVIGARALRTPDDAAAVEMIAYWEKHQRRKHDQRLTDLSRRGYGYAGDGTY